MTKKKVITKNPRYCYDEPQYLERPRGVSMTIPGEALTLKEILERHTQGILPQEHNGEYMEDADIDDDVRMYSPDLDLTDIDEMRKDVETINEKIKNIKPEKKKNEPENDPEEDSEEVVETEEDVSQH